MNDVQKLFGSLVFNETVMKDRLPTATYKAYKQAIIEGKPLNIEIANIIANAMKDWALEHGCTHFTHWFQPMTGITAEKHESFISPTAEGRVIMDFSGKELIQGEPDASSFPSGGLRATFEARGYTAWDPTSYAFIKDNCLCIPTAFCSYTGEVLDKKTPLLRSMNAVSKAACNILKIFGINTVRVNSTVGPEQEYFLVDKKMWEKRKDLVYCGRTLFGAKSPRGQELEDHYFGIIKQRVLAFMKDLDEELWKLGVLAKTEHNEVAPAQHELAPIFSSTNVASDHNQLMMEFMKRVALRHGLVCLLHEKPFDGVNGSGKHNNWSLATEEGMNLLDPGKEPYKNLRFLTFLAAILKAVDEYQDLLRVSVASAGNDHRLGANEAPPAIVSVFLGTELTAVLEAIAADMVYTGNPAEFMKISDDTIPALVKDNTDRNRTSPFAFTGNKFEFRMLGSMFSIAGPNVVLNTIVAEELDEFAAKLADAPDLEAAVYDLVKETYKAHKRIVFNGNGYTDEWVAEAAKRGLLNLKSTPEALPYLGSEKNIALFAKHHIFTEAEVKSRVEILLENYSTTISIEAATALDMFHKDILPAVAAYTEDLTKAVLDKKAAGISAGFEAELASKLSDLSAEMYAASLKLDADLKEAAGIECSKKQATFYHDAVVADMEALRKAVDAAEDLTGGKYLPYPTYGELLFGVNE
ncbi:glutamine synthetase III [Phascolarctobacterium sp.]|uniref:glutamine synthetase III family protein n=1 Tax=Phascolarctobacterium sp. TaxID=2049039 RepID=UPI002A7F1982|nr:glutamine synthetase III [Phascolarctobacterium sp.]MDY5044902.1 glutamine synthetase III [Phascolarctobacterium sp.]